MKVHTRAIAVTLVLVLLLAGCGDSEDDASSTKETGGPTPARAEELLGAKNPAEGEPVLVGVISNGKTTAIDNQIELDVADATVKWWNDRHTGVGGRPVELVTCIDEGEPGKAADCATELIQKDVVAVLIGSSGVVLNAWQPLVDAQIPVIAYGGSGDMLTEEASTFIMGTGAGSVTTVAVQAANDAEVKEITVVVIDVPTATDLYEAAAPELESEHGISLDIVPIALGTPDMTPQMQKVVSENPDGVVNVLGNDTFCISTFNGLRAAGFTGTITTAAPCISDATRKAVPGDFLEGMQVAYNAPVGDTSNPSTQQYEAVMKAYGADSVDLSRVTGYSMFQTVGGFLTGVEGIAGEITPATVVTTIKGMEWKELPGAGGLHFRCNGNADPENPAVCLTGTLISSLDAEGRPTTFEKSGDEEIPD